MKKGGVEWDEKISGWFFNGDISSEIMGDAWLIYGEVLGKVVLFPMRVIFGITLGGLIEVSVFFFGFRDASEI